MDFYESERAARLFDLQNENDPVLMEEQRFFLQEIEASDGLALDIGCGTGRILLAALEHGARIVGFDVSHALLQELHRKARQVDLPSPPRVFQAQMQSLCLRKGSITLAFAAFRTFNHLTTYDEQLDFLSRVREALRPEQGRLLLNTTNPDPMELHSMIGQKLLIRDDLIWGDDALRVAWWGASQYDERTGLIHQIYHYDFVEESGRVRESFQYPLTMCWISPDVMRALARDAGFEVTHCWSEFQKEEFRIGTGDAVWELRPTSTK